MMKILISLILLGAVVSQARADDDKHSHTLYLAEGNSIVLTYARDGSATTQDRSFLSDVVTQISSARECSGVTVAGQNKGDGNTIQIFIDVAEYALSFSTVSLSREAAARTRGPQLTVQYDLEGPNHASKQGQVDSFSSLASEVCAFMTNQTASTQPDRHELPHTRLPREYPDANAGPHGTRGTVKDSAAVSIQEKRKAQKAPAGASIATQPSGDDSRKHTLVDPARQ